MNQITEVYPGTTVRDIVTSTTPGWSVLNPSIAQGDASYRCIVRSSNFVERNGEYLVTDPENIVRTKNYLCDLSPSDLSIQSFDLIDTSEVEPEIKFSLVQNMEDARLFFHRGYWWASGTSREHRSDGTPKIALDRLVGAKAVERTYMDGPDYYSCEKNWMPFPIEEDWHRWVYNCASSQITDGAVIREFGPSGDAPREMRGSSQVIPITGRGDFIGVTHEVTFFQTTNHQRWQRQYWHRFVLFDERGCLINWTEPFYFVSPGIEFANGIVEWQDHFAVSFGHRDERAMLALVPTAPVLGSGR